MFRDISVLLPVDRPAGALIDCAASVAALFEAHLDGIVCVYQATNPMIASEAAAVVMAAEYETSVDQAAAVLDQFEICLLYTSDAADDSLRVDLGGRRIIKKKIF